MIPLVIDQVGQRCAGQPPIARADWVFLTTIEGAIGVSLIALAIHQLRIPFSDLSKLGDPLLLRRIHISALVIGSAMSIGFIPRVASAILYLFSLLARFYQRFCIVQRAPPPRPATTAQPPHRSRTPTDPAG